MTEINYSWVIRKLECISLENELSNVVKTVHWTYQAQEQIEGGKFAEISNQYPLTTPPLPENYIDYSNLTENVIIEWLENNLDVGYLRSYLQDKIEKLYLDEVVLPLPWIKEPEIEVIPEVPEETIIPVEPPVEETIIPVEPPVEETILEN